ncbi:hypothetical protein [Methylobacterium sp. WL6]|uniref:hypothetical protein n=1 Tax=Methylobacterium sp. WL6 TaxID=2603901 RepID=UPI0011CBAF46|nr:hypothetical protein [Methylobacterium sp. WL6]TXN67273.1 hypothetical protein FV230_14520 [Methylobacterium sp. WL6]
MSLKAGMAARVRPVIIEGTVERVRFDEDTGEKRVLFAWTGADGEPHSRWFPEGDLDAVEPVAEPAAA